MNFKTFFALRWIFQLLLFLLWIKVPFQCIASLWYWPSIIGNCPSPNGEQQTQLERDKFSTVYNNGDLSIWSINQFWPKTYCSIPCWYHKLHSKFWSFCNLIVFELARNTPTQRKSEIKKTFSGSRWLKKNSENGVNSKLKNYQLQCVL